MKLAVDEPFSSLNLARVGTLQAAIVLTLARLMVRFVPFALWRKTLGSWSGGSAGATTNVNEAADPVARAWAGRIERAAYRLPGESRCLPRAIALYWILRRCGIAVQLVVALHRSEREAEHAYHAWVDHAGEMLVGACDRSEYRPVMQFSYQPTAAVRAKPA